MSWNRIDYKRGEMIGSVIYLYELPYYGAKRRAVFKCDCGNAFPAMIDKVKRLETQSCGCLHKIAVAKSNSTHKMANKHPLYDVWKGMKGRCYNENTTQYKDYGGRGVTVCDEWKHDFLAFYKWSVDNGYKKGLQIDKDTKSNSLIYSPSTCAYVLPKENSNRRRTSKYITYDGKTLTISEWATFFNISLKNLYQRLSRGWSFEKCIENAI